MVIDCVFFRVIISRLDASWVAEEPQSEPNQEELLQVSVLILNYDFQGMQIKLMLNLSW